MPRPASTTPATERHVASPRPTIVRLLIACLGVLLAVAVVPTVLAPPATAQMSDDAAQQAAREIQAARDRANAAAEAFLQAQSDLEVLQDDADSLEDDAGRLQGRVDRLRRDVQSVAIARFATSGSKGIPLLTGLQAPKDQVQADVFSNVVTDAGTSTLDEFDFAQKELADKQRELEQRRDEVEDQQAVFRQLQEQANAEVKRLREIEEQRLTDEAVLRALAAQRAAALSKLEEAQLRNAEAAARAQPNPGVLAAQAAMAAAAAAEAAAADPDADPDSDPADVAAAVDGPPVATLAPNTGASGGTSGGRTGTGGAGSAPIGVLNGDVYIDAIVCPMPGSAYGDSWGAPRSGGRRHEGVDMLAPTGTPIYAVVSGTVSFRQNRLGGNAVSLAGDNGNRYYYAHLSRYEGASRRVAQGDVIGYNGDTGNATGVPHLHFEVHPGGGLAVNPTPSVRAAGC
jgi:murein DD-endopeptidase MepM/ murein hydrolase activator NlpD